MPNQTFPLTSVQKAYILGRKLQLNYGGVATHIYVEAIYNKIDIAKLERCINRLVKRHIGLRTVFTDHSQQYLNKISDYYIKFEILKNKKALISKRAKLSHQVLDHTKFPLFNIEVSYIEETSNYVLHLGWDMLIFDASSIKIFLDELDILYKDENSVLPQITTNFRKYMLTQNQKTNSLEYTKRLELEKAYWINKFSEFKFSNSLPLKSSDKIFVSKFKSITKEINKDIWHNFVQKAKSHKVSTARSLMFLYGLVICYYNNQDSTLLNITLSKRSSEEGSIHSVIADFTSLALHDFNFDNINFLALVQQNNRQFNRNLINSKSMDAISIQQLVRQIYKLDLDQLISPLVFTYGYDNYRCAPLLGADKINLNYIISQTPQVLLDNKIFNLNDTMCVWWDYVHNVLIEQSVKDMFALYCELIEYYALNDWDTPIPLNLRKNANRLICEANSAEMALPNFTLISYYENKVRRFNRFSKVAVIEANSDKKYTYQTLFTESNLLAKFLLKYYKHTGILQGQLFGLLSEKSYNHVIVITSVMKAGFAYLPLNIMWPIDTIFRVADEGQLNVIFISKKQYQIDAIRIPLAKKYRLIIIEEALAFIRNKESSINNLDVIKLPKITTNNIAYVIFTSGSTGRPKGVVITHKSALNTILAVNKKYKVNAQDKVLAISGISFDLSVYDIFGLLGATGTIVFPNHDLLRDTNHWVDVITKYQITIWNTVPQLCYLLIDNLKLSSLTLPSLRLFLLSGDKIPIKLPTEIKETLPRALIVGLGGATEGSIWSIWYEISKVNSIWTSIPYGIAMPNQKMYVLDKFLNHCHIGVTGDIYIGGLGVAVEYLNNPEKTKASFINHSNFGRLYKTGDLGKWNLDGYIDILGRIDNQVKINGYRVELEEISHHIEQIPEIERAVVIFKNNSLFCYYVLIHSGNLFFKIEEAEYFRNILEEKLPSYMVPSYYAELKSIPITVNGKVDIKALPDIVLKEEKNYVAPRTEPEKDLVRIYSSILSIEETKISISDDFFKLGGDSILAIQLISKLRRLDYTCSLNDIIKYRTILELAKNCIKVKKSSKIADINYNKFSRSDPKSSLLPIQQWFWNIVEHGAIKNFNYWNQSFLIKVPALNLDLLERSLVKLANRHTVLKSIFNDNTKHSYNKNSEIPKIKVIDAKKVNPCDYFSQWQSDFDVRNGKLWAVGYVKNYDNNSDRIFFAFHHLIIDTVSWNILTNDLRDSYNNKTLPKITCTYATWCQYLSSYANNYHNELFYWKNIVKQSAKINIAQSFTMNELIRSYKCVIDISSELSLANAIYNTETKELLITALLYTVAKLKHGTKRVAITFEGHGRESLENNLDLSETIGWFTTMYPIVCEYITDIGQCIRINKEIIRNIPNKGLGFGAFCLNGSMSPQDLPLVGFNYLGQFHNGNEFWSTTQEYSGLVSDAKNKLHNLINFSCIIVKNELHIMVDTMLDKTDDLSQLYAENIQKIIAHCQSKVLKKKDFGYKTISDFIDFIPYEVINPNLEGTPFFIFPPSNGGAEVYLNNALVYLKSRKIVAFNNFYRYLQKQNKESINLSIEELANLYIIKMQVFDLTQPIKLIGWSFGGILAFEVARQLLIMGFKVDCVLMIDAYFNYKKVFSHLNKEQQMYLIGDPNLNYDPPKCDELFTKSRIILAKSVMEPSVKEIKRISSLNNLNSAKAVTFLKKLHKYFTSSKANHLEDISDKFKILTLNTDHYSVINSPKIYQNL